MQNILPVIKLDQGRHGQPVWISTEQSLFWVDHANRRLYQYQVDTGNVSTCDIDAPILNISPCINHGFIASLEDGIGFFNIKERKVTYISKPEPFSTNKTIGGITDAAGYYWSYTQPEEGSNRQANLYQVSPSMRMQKFSDEHWLATAPPVFSSDGFTMYQSSGSNRYIYATRLNESKEPVTTEAICRISKSEGYPHGLCVDSEDNIWVCHKEAALISCYDKEGELLKKIKINAPGAEYCVFGGKNLELLFVITSAMSEDVSTRKKAHANALLSIEPGVTGLQTKSFVG